MPNPVWPTSTTFSCQRRHTWLTAHLDDPSVHPLSVELPIKAFQSRQFAEPHTRNPPVEGTLSSGFRRAGEQAMQELQMAQ